MSLKQVSKDFEELYPGRNQRKLLEEYYKQKKKEIFITIIAFVLLFLLVFYSDFRSLSLEKNNHLIRSTSEQKDQEISLNVKRGNKDWEELNFLLSAKKYSEKELEIFYEELIEGLQEYYLGENESPDKIFYSLNFPTEIDGYPFVLSWKSYNPDMIDNLGKVIIDGNEEDIPVEIGLTVTYENWEREYRFFVTVVKNEISNGLYLLKRKILEEEKDRREEVDFFLPEYFLGEELKWRYQGKNRAGFIILSFLPTVVFLWFQKDRELNKNVINKRKRLKKEYPNFVNRLVLYLGVGISSKESIFYIYKEMKKQEHNNALYEELNYICVQMKNGLPEKRAYEILGKRCAVSEYRKLMALLTQYLEKGSSKLLVELKEEAANSREEEFKEIRKIGEEIGTKLLFPMMMLLGLVMILIMIPAMYSFRI